MKKNVKASYTIEPSMVMPLILFFIFQGFALDKYVNSLHNKRKSHEKSFRNCKERTSFRFSAWHDQYGDHLPEDDCDAFEFNWYFQYIRKECPLYNDAS